MLNEFKLIVAGGRDFNDYPTLEKTLNDLSNGVYANYAISIVSGMARGADALGFHFAKRNHVQIHKFPADWDRYGNRAGHLRNEQMGKFADGLLAFWDGKSRGTKHMIDFMNKLGKPVHIVNY